MPPGFPPRTVLIGNNMSVEQAIQQLRRMMVNDQSLQAIKRGERFVKPTVLREKEANDRWIGIFRKGTAAKNHIMNTYK